MIKLNDLQQPPEVMEAVKKVIENGRFVKGPIVEEFEKAWAARCNMRYAIGVSSGAMALELAIQAAIPPINRGASLSTQSYTYKAIGNAIRRMGYNFFIDDINPIIYAHHLHDSLPNIVPLIEDCSHVHSYVPVADIAIFSFFPAKILGGVTDGGIIVTNIKEIDEKCRSLRDHGEPLGTNSRMSEINAAALLAKLPLLTMYVEERKRIVDMYDKGLGRKTPGEIFYSYTIEGSEEKRQKFLSMGVESKFYYTPQYMALPLHPFLKDSEIEYIIDCVKKL